MQQRVVLTRLRRRSCLRLNILPRKRRIVQNARHKPIHNLPVRRDLILPKLIQPPRRAAHPRAQRHQVLPLAKGFYEFVRRMLEELARVGEGGGGRVGEPRARGIDVVPEEELGGGVEGEPGNHILEVDGEALREARFGLPEDVVRVPVEDVEVRDLVLVEEGAGHGAVESGGELSELLWVELVVETLTSTYRHQS